MWSRVESSVCRRDVGDQAVGSDRACVKPTRTTMAAEFARRVRRSRSGDLGGGICRRTEIHSAFIGWRVGSQAKMKAAAQRKLIATGLLLLGNGCITQLLSRR